MNRNVQRIVISITWLTLLSGMTGCASSDQARRIVELETRVAKLEKQSPSETLAARSEMLKQKALINMELVGMRRNVGDKHPDVVTRESKLAEIERSLVDLSK